MMKKVLSITIFHILLPLALYSQDNLGYYGKKTFITASSSSYSPLFYQLVFYNEGYELSPSGNSLVPKKDWFNIGYRLSAGRVLHPKIGFALEFGYDQITLNDELLFEFSFEEDPYNAHENLRVNSFLVLPRIEISGRDGLLPSGLVHQIGFGMNTNTIVRKNYLLDHGNYYTGGPNGAPDDEQMLFSDYDLEGKIRLWQLMYGLKIRSPIAKFLMFTYGFRYTIDFGRIPQGFNESVGKEIKQYQFWNIIAFDLGLTLPL